MKAMNMSAIDRIVALLNSRGVGFDTEDLLQQRELGPLARRTLGLEVGIKADTQALRALRSALLGLVRGDDGAVAALNDVASQRSFHFVFEASGGVALAADERSALAQLLQDAANVVRDHSWERFKFCGDPKCGTAFFDHTRGKTRRWCSVATCGNKANVAAHRNRASAT